MIKVGVGYLYAGTCYCLILAFDFVCLLPFSLDDTFARTTYCVECCPLSKQDSRFRITSRSIRVRSNNWYFASQFPRSRDFALKDSKNWAASLFSYPLVSVTIDNAVRPSKSGESTSTFSVSRRTFMTATSPRNAA